MSSCEFPAAGNLAANFSCFRQKTTNSAQNSNFLPFRREKCRESGENGPKWNDCKHLRRVPGHPTLPRRESAGKTLSQIGTSAARRNQPAAQAQSPAYPTLVCGVDECGAPT
jgi:hypothetical protein